MLGFGLLYQKSLYRRLQKFFKANVDIVGMTVRRLEEPYKMLLKCGTLKLGHLVVCGIRLCTTSIGSLQAEESIEGFFYLTKALTSEWVRKVTGSAGIWLASVAEKVTGIDGRAVEADVRWVCSILA